MPNSNTIILIIVVAMIAAIVAVGLYHFYLQWRSRHLRSHFGPEYARLAESKGDARAAESELAGREKRVAKFHIRPLTPEENTRFTRRWRNVQAEFVDDPKGSLSRADDLLGDVMAARGYPVQDFEQRSADLSVDHPVVVQHYHEAHHIALRHRKGETTTEDLRQAMIHYRALFDELVADSRRATAAE